MVFPNRYGNNKSRGPAPDKCIVLIALEDLTPENGLMRWKDGPVSIKKGGWSYFKGDQEHEFDENGGGLAIYLELKILVKSSKT